MCVIANALLFARIGEHYFIHESFMNCCDLINFFMDFLFNAALSYYLFTFFSLKFLQFQFLLLLLHSVEDKGQR